MKNIYDLTVFEMKKMLRAKSTIIYAAFFFINYIISVIFFKLYGNEGSVLTVGNAQSFPIQHLPSSYLFAGIFIAVYVAQIVTQECSRGTIKLILLRSVSRLEYYASRITSIFLFSVFLVLMMLALSYITGWIFFGWGDKMVFNTINASGIHGILITLKSGFAYAFVYFIFGLIALVVSIFTRRLLESVIIMGGMLMAGQYFELLPDIKQFAIFHHIYFFGSDLLEKNLRQNIGSVAILCVYLLFFAVSGYFIFRKKDLFV